MILIRPSYEILTEIDGDKILKNIERAGRTCYKSEDKITADSAEKFCRGIIKSGHHSVIEHENISVRFVCDRGVTHELVRHRLAAYSQESTRYCTYKSGVTFIIPPWIDIAEGEYALCDEWDEKIYYYNEDEISAEQLWFEAMQDTEASYIDLLNCGWSPQQARSVLPNSLKTEIVMTANLREWRWVFELRCSTAAHPQIREIMIPLRTELRMKIPAIFE